MASARRNNPNALCFGTVNPFVHKGTTGLTILPFGRLRASDAKLLGNVQRDVVHGVATRHKKVLLATIDHEVPTPSDDWENEQVHGSI